jgi:PAS domain-containing protein
MKRMTTELEIAKVTLLLLILVVLFFQKRKATTPAEVIYKYKLQDAAIANTANNAIVITDVNNKVVLWNTGAEKLFGYTKDKAVGNDLRLISISLPDFVLKDTPVDTEALHALKSMIPISLTVSECKVGDAVHYVAYMKGIRERREREELTAKELQLLNEGEAIGGFGSWSWAVNAPDMKTDRVMVTDGFNLIFESDDFVTDVKFLMDRVWHEDQERVFALLRKAQETKSDYEVEYRIQRKNGKIIWLHCRGKMYLTGNGNIEKIVGTIQKVNKNV